MSRSITVAAEFHLYQRIGQWAEPLFLDLLEHLAEWVHDSPTVLVGLARPELRELRPSLTEVGRVVSDSIALEGLDAEATAELAARLVGADSLPRELIDRLPDSTEGNPLFVRELMRMLVDDGVIVKQFIEPEKPGDPFEVSDADTMLEYLAPGAGKPHDILLLTKPGCPHCARAKSALREKGLQYEEIVANTAMLRAVSDTPTTPRVFADGQLIGGADELVAWLTDHA